MNDRLHDIEAVQALLGGLGRTSVFKLLQPDKETGVPKLRAVKIGKRTMVPQSEIDRYIAGLLDERTPA